MAHSKRVQSDAQRKVGCRPSCRHESQGGCTSVCDALFPADNIIDYQHSLSLLRLRRLFKVAGRLEKKVRWVDTTSRLVSEIIIEAAAVAAEAEAEAEEES